MNIRFLDFIIVFGSILGYFISVSLLTSSFFKSKANNYLSLTIFFLCSIILLGWYDANEGLLSFLQDIMWDFLFPVTLFSYFLIQLNHFYINKKWYKLLYLPFVTSVLFEILLKTDYIFGFFNIYEQYFLAIELYFEFLDIVSFLYSVVLIIWGRNLIKASKLTSVDKKKWLLKFNLIMLGVHIIWFLFLLEDVFLDTEYSLNVLWTILSFLSWWILYYGVFKFQIVIQKDEIHQYLTNQEKGGKKIKNCRTDSTSKYISQLYTLMNEDELYKNPLLSRLDLANRLEISESYLSKIINEELNKNFIQFVKEYRIECAKELLLNPMFHKYSIEAIGLEAGFNSKSTFYNTFKTQVKVSPNSFRKLKEES